MDTVLHVLGALGIMVIGLLPQAQRPSLWVAVAANAVLWPGREWAQNGPPWGWSWHVVAEGLAPVAAALIFVGLYELWRRLT